MISEDRIQRVLFLTDVLGGGTGKHLLAMLNCWDKTHWQAKIVSQTRPTSLVSSQLPITYLPSWGWFERYPLSQIHRLVQCQQYITRHPPDLLHCYFFWPIIYGRILKRLGRVQFLVENREDQGFDWGKHEYALLRLTRAMPDRVICVSESIRQVVLKKERLDPSRVVVVHNGVEPVQERTVDTLGVRQELGLSEDQQVVGMVANFNRSVKGVSYFLDAIPSIVQAVPSARFLLLGRGNEERALRDKARTLGIEPYVIFAGYREEVGRYYAIMDVSVLTSLSEGLSITLLESMCHGLPVVVTRVGGNPEVVVEGQTGYLVPPKDIPAFVCRTVELLRNPELRTRMGCEGRKRIEQRFQLRDVSQQYLQLYTKCLTNRYICSSLI